MFKFQGAARIFKKYQYRNKGILLVFKKHIWIS